MASKVGLLIAARPLARAAPESSVVFGCYLKIKERVGDIDPAILLDGYAEFAARWPETE